MKILDDTQSSDQSRQLRGNKKCSSPANPDSHTIRPILTQSLIPLQSHCNYSTNVPEYIELELHVGTLVDELREDCTRIEICLQSGQNRRQKDKRNGAAISGQPLAILSSAAVPQFYLVLTISKPIMHIHQSWISNQPN